MKSDSATGNRKFPNQLSQAEIDRFVDRPISIAAFARVLGVTAPALSHSAINFRPGWTFRACIQAVNSHRRESASGHTGTLADERARLAAIQTERIEMDLAERRSELIPVGVLTKTLSAAIAASVQHLEAVPGRVRMRDPSLTAAQSLIIEDEIARARNVIAETKLEL